MESLSSQSAKITLHYKLLCCAVGPISRDRGQVKFLFVSKVRKIHFCSSVHWTFSKETSKITMLPSTFYGKRRETAVVPVHPDISDDDEDDEDEDDDVSDPDFVPPTHNQDIPGPSNIGPTTKRKRLQPAVEVIQDSGSDSYSEDNDDDDNEQPAPQAKKPSKPSKSAARPTTWHKVDLNNTALPEYQHSTPDYIDVPFQYFTRYFDDQIIRHITYQTNLYAAQKDINTTFTTNENEILTFVAILIYMGIVELPSVDDYWAIETRVPQVAQLMSSKRFRLLKRVIHFNDNSMICGTSDRFFKIRPLFRFINTAFRRESQTPKQSVDEVMVAYKGKKAGNLRQYIKSKPDKWGFKLFARASEDGFIHDIVLYQGKTTLEAHDVPLKPEQEGLGATSQIVSVLASTMTFPTTTAIYADNFFTSLELVRYLRDHNCRFTGTARDNRIGKPPLRTIKDMEKKAVTRGTCDYVTSDDGILAVRDKHRHLYSSEGLLSNSVIITFFCQHFYVLKVMLKCSNTLYVFFLYFIYVYVL
ncbi:piggyBac transposable element-derived protein 3 [Fundulus heteroclitus]|uniref:piggyBac transposable element-derived protein 3 n=1 Tax=Fundulus heteroclitus TaxID=8078 RepID=UPI00165CAA4E|nr:piggyBac transposable element-derived protein 3 [Fundulus heteroclitus]